jgi:hypothetical protein
MKDLLVNSRGPLWIRGAQFGKGWSDPFIKYENINKLIYFIVEFESVNWLTVIASKHSLLHQVWR